MNASYPALRYHSMTQDEYQARLASQGGRCAVCKRAMHYPLYIDHDHGCCGVNVKKTCKRCTRGLLCARCNSGLGSFQDSVLLLREAVRYLEEWTR